MGTSGTGSSWPPLPTGKVDADTPPAILFKAKVDDHAAILKEQREQVSTEDKADNDHIRALAAADRAADLTNLGAYYTTLSTLAIGAVERARAGADTVMKASAAIVTLYTGILALAFSASSKPLPTRGVLAPIFLGLAVVLSTAYLGYVNASTAAVKGTAPEAALEGRLLGRLRTVTEAARDTAGKRSWTVRSSVLSLGVGLAFIALPFISLGTTTPPAAAATPAVTATLPAWPAPTTGIPDTLNAIVYKAQVDEVAAARTAAATKAATPAPIDDTNAIIGLLIGGLVVTFLPLLFWRDPNPS